MKPIEFLKKNTYSFTPEQYTEAFNDIKTMDDAEWAAKWGPIFEQHENLAVAWNNSDLSKSVKNKWERMREAFGSSDKANPFNKPEADLKAKWAKDFKDMDFNAFKKDVATMSQHWENEKKAREYESARYKRSKQVEDDAKFWLASDYSKQRYINEPEKSVFSDEGKWYNKGDDVRDVMLGGLGLAGDFIPGWGAWVGPAARAARDWANYGTDYGKDIGGILKERGADLATYGMAAGLQNFRRGKRILGEAGNNIPVIGNTLQNAAFTESIKETDKGLGILMLTKDLDKAKKAIDAMPDNSIKGRLLKEFGDFAQYGNPEAEQALLERLKIMAKGEASDLHNYTIALDAERGANYVPINTEQLGTNIPGEFTSPLRVKGEQAAVKNADIKQAARFTPKLGKAGVVVRDVVLPVERNVEQGVAKQLSNFYGAPVKDKDRKLKDWYKQHYAKDWEMGFKPNEKEGDPLWEAYKEYKGLK